VHKLCNGDWFRVADNEVTVLELVSAGAFVCVSDDVTFTESLRTDTVSPMTEITEMVTTQQAVKSLFCVYSPSFGSAKHYENGLRFDRITVKFTLLRFMNHGVNVHFDISR